MTDVTPTESTADLDGLAFRMISSTASRVDPDSPTLFHYRQQGDLLWGRYSGDTVTEGRFVGRAVGDIIQISFAHALVEGDDVVTGSATSRIESRADGLLYLVEDFEKDGRPHTSVCAQVV